MYACGLDRTYVVLASPSALRRSAHTGGPSSIGRVRWSARFPFSCSWRSHVSLSLCRYLTVVSWNILGWYICKSCLESLNAGCNARRTLFSMVGVQLFLSAYQHVWRSEEGGLQRSAAFGKGPLGRLAVILVLSSAPWRLFFVLWRCPIHERNGLISSELLTLSSDSCDLLDDSCFTCRGTPRVGYGLVDTSASLQRGVSVSRVFEKLG